MLKRRLVAVISVRGGIAVQSIGFRQYLPIGKPEILAEFLNEWGVDEIIVLDHFAYRSGIDFGLIERISRSCQVPLAYGGGIRRSEEFNQVVQAGADKVVINLEFWNQPDLITAGAHALGNQGVVVALDAIRTERGWGCFDHSTRATRADDPRSAALRAVELGAGEIFLNSVDRDGSKQGFDLELVRNVGLGLRVPLLVCGGAGEPAHFAQALEVPEVMAVCAANFFSYTEHSVAAVKGFLSQTGSAVRPDPYIDYRGTRFEPSGRIARHSEAKLDEMLFERHVREAL